MTSPVKQGLEQRGSWGLKCLFSADRRLCWISTVHAQNGNLSLSLSSLSGVWLVSSRKAPVNLQRFLLRGAHPGGFSSSSSSPVAQRGAEHFYGKCAGGGGKRIPCTAFVSPMGHLGHAFGWWGTWGHSPSELLRSLLCCRAKKLSTRKKNTRKCHRQN